jgi:hypothetical protein
MAGIAFSLRAARSITSLPFQKPEDYDLNFAKSEITATTYWFNYK